MSSWGGGTKFQNYGREVTFIFLVPNLPFFLHDFKKNLNLMSSWGWGSNFLILFGLGGHKIFEFRWGLS